MSKSEKVLSKELAVYKKDRRPTKKLVLASSSEPGSQPRSGLSGCELTKRMGEIFKEHNNALVRFLVSRLGSNAQHADDIAQECFFRLSRYNKPTISNAELRSLLYQIARNILIDFYRHGKVIHAADHVDIEDHEIASSAPSQERIISGQENLNALKNVLATLPPRCQEVFVLSRFEEMKYEDIASRCGISVSMVEKHVAKAMKTIKHELCVEDLFSIQPKNANRK